MEYFNQDYQQQKLPKMIIFKMIQNNFAMAGISPKLVTQPYPFNGKIFMGFLILTSAVNSIGVFVFNYAATFIEYTQTIYLGSLAILIIFALIILILKVKKLFKYIKHADQLVNTTLKYSESRSMYYETNQFEGKLSEFILFVMIKMTPAGAFVPWAIYIYFLYFTSDLGADAFDLPCPMWFPFDWKNPIGFMIAIAIQYVMLSYMTTIGGCVIALAVGAFLYGIAMSKCIKGSLFAISRNTRDRTVQSHLLKQITEFLELHSQTKQVINDFSDTFQHFFTILFTWSLIVICGALLMIQIQLTHHSDNLVRLLVIIIEVFYAFGVLFISCELGQRFSLAFDECSEMVDQFEWYLFPGEIQRMLPLILNFTQQPIDIKCFGSKASDRETFKSVIKTAFSYFTVLRQFYH